MNLATLAADVKNDAVKVGSFLKAAEHDVAIVIEDAATVAPKVAEVAEGAAVSLGYPEVAVFLQKALSLIVGAGAIVSQSTNGTGSGLDKLAVAAPLVDNLIKGSGFLGANAVADVSKYDNAVKVITGGLADLGDSLAKASAPVAANPAPGASSAPAGNAAANLASTLGMNSNN
jgi:hypothetical protein